MDEASYLAGKRRVYIELASQVIVGLNATSEVDGLSRDELLIRFQRERAEAIQALRNVCERHGDNDWRDTLYLADIIEKHLAKHLEEAQRARGV